MSKIVQFISISVPPSQQYIICSLDNSKDIKQKHNHGDLKMVL
jgi:hypothetical protein